MSAHEFASRSQEPSVESYSPPSARKLLAQNALKLGTYYFDFHHPYYEKYPEKHSSVLAYGETDNTIILARHGNSRGSLNPDSYLVHQYDLEAQHRTTWNVVSPPTFTGRGDTLEQTIALQKQGDSAKAALFLSSRGNTWRESTNREKLLASSILLPYQALYDLHLTIDELRAKLDSETDTR